MITKDAIKVFLEYSPQARQVIKRIELWNPQDGLKGNVKNCGFNSSNAANKFQKRYNLKHNSTVGRPRKCNEK